MSRAAKTYLDTVSSLSCADYTYLLYSIQVFREMCHLNFPNNDNFISKGFGSVLSDMGIISTDLIPTRAVVVQCQIEMNEA
jgi:hypothetical protein